MADTPSGAWTPGQNGQPAVSDSFLSDKDVFFAGATTDVFTDNQFSFDTYIKEIVIQNEGSADLAFQWARLFSTTKESGVVKSGQQVILRNANKTGIALKSRVSGSPTNFLVYGV